MKYDINVSAEKLEKQIEKLEVIHLPKVTALKTVKAFDPAAILTALCGAISIATPLLKIVLSLPFIGKKAKASIKRILDTVSQWCAVVG